MKIIIISLIALVSFNSFAIDELCTATYTQNFNLAKELIKKGHSTDIVCGSIWSGEEKLKSYVRNNLNRKWKDLFGIKEWLDGTFNEVWFYFNIGNINTIDLNNKEMVNSILGLITRKAHGHEYIIFALLSPSSADNKIILNKTEIIFIKNLISAGAPTKIDGVSDIFEHLSYFRCYSEETKVEFECSELITK